MIIGLGTDIVNISRIGDILEKSGDRFKRKYFTAHEIESANKYSQENKQAVAAHFAKRFAAKEAFAKAAGTGLGEYLSFSDIGVENNSNGKPSLLLSEKASEFINKLTNKKDSICHVSLSDDYPNAIAVVIIEQL